MPVNGNHGGEKNSKLYFKIGLKNIKWSLHIHGHDLQTIVEGRIVRFGCLFFAVAHSKPIFNLDSSLDSGNSPIRAVSASAVTKQQLWWRLAPFLSWTLLLYDSNSHNLLSTMCFSRILCLLSNCCHLLGLVCLPGGKLVIFSVGKCASWEQEGKIGY